MPGNEVGDRVHNFFGQENLSEDQHHSQVVHGNWPGLNNNLLVGSQRQIGASFISDLKNYNVQQSGINKLSSSFVGFCWLVQSSRVYLMTAE
jgi:ribonuclease I